MSIDEKVFDAAVNDLPESLKNLFRKRLEEYEAAKGEQADIGKAISEQPVDCREALKWLIALKAHKDEHGKTPHYEEMQPKAWAAAKRALAAPESEAEVEPICYEDDGCPMENAVLKRFWREHQKAPKRESLYQAVETIPEVNEYAFAVAFTISPPELQRHRLWSILQKYEMAKSEHAMKSPHIQIEVEKP